MSIEKFFPISPDLNIREESDMTLAKFGHLNALIATCSNFGTGQYQITLPFPSVATMRQAGGSLHQVTGAALYHIAGVTDTAISSTIHKLYYSGSTTDLAWKNTTPVGGTSVTSHFDISGVYEIV